MSDISYEGIHCEVGMHVVIEDINTVKAFERNIENIKREKETIQVK